MAMNEAAIFIEEEVKQLSKCPVSGESPEEERVNYLTHLVGLCLSVVGALVLFTYSCLFGSGLCMISCGVYGFTLILLYAASTFYHRSQTLQHKALLRILDHASIYLLIAGCYTPFVLGPLKSSCGWHLFWIEWSIACVGIVFKLFLTHRFQLMSTLAYIGMGWLIVFGIYDLIEALPFAVIALLVSGGISYSLGALFFLRQSMPFNHGIWHLFVLCGGICHYFAIFGMVMHDLAFWQ